MGIPDDIVRLEQSLRELITRYELYFFGIEKREPLRLLEDVERQAKRYQNVSIANSTLRFKYDSLLATLTQHRQKWRRIGTGTAQKAAAGKMKAQTRLHGSTR